MDTEAARENMITQQIRCCGVLDNDVLETIRNTPRELFVPEDYQKLAFADTDLPIGHGQKLWSPLEEARILQALDVYPDDKILEIGTLNGYMTALLAQMGQHVYTVDYFANFTRNAKHQLSELNITNVTFDTGNATEGWGYYAPYDVILLNASYPDIPEGFHEDLNEYGRMFAVLGYEPAMEATLVQRWALDEWRRHYLFETVRPRMPGLEKQDTFLF